MEQGQIVQQTETMPVWAVCVIAGIFAVTFLLLTLIYMPRNEEILKLRRTIKTLRKKIDQMSKDQTAETLAHTADVGELSEKLLQAEGKQDQIAEEYAGKLAKANARTEQSESIREQLARAADKLRGEAVA